MSAVPTDEIYERYLKKAITEINELGDEIGREGDESRVPVLGSGHPLADVFLLKYEPQPSEVQEGVAFYGRAGQALLKSLQRLHVDPMAVYGTNCLKFVGQEPRRRRAVAPPRAAHRAAEARRRDGRARARVPERARVPARRRARREAPSELQRFTPTIEALVAPDIDGSLDEQPAKTALLERVQGGRRLGGPSCRRTEPRRAAALVALAVALSPVHRGGGAALGGRPPLGRRVPRARARPRLLPRAWLLLPLARQPGLLPIALALLVLALLLRAAELDVLSNLAKLLALTLVGFWFLTFFEAVSWVVLVAVVIPFVDAISVWRGPTDYIVSEQPRSSTTSRSPSGSPARTRARTSARRTSSSSRSSSPPPQRFGLRVAWTWVAMVALPRPDDRAHRDVRTWPACRRCRRSRFGFLPPNADLLWRALRPAQVADSVASRSSSATVSTCGVCGNMSTGLARTSS